MFIKHKYVLYLLILWLSLHGCSQVHLLSEISKVPNQQAAKNKSDIHSFYGRYKIGKPYQINGEWYYPKEPTSNIERGIASWYGPGFHGKVTANGALFDMNKVSAAHKTLPLPAIVNVINLENGKKLKILVNDRGPYKDGRIIDLSRKAAELLEFRKQGVALVEVEYLPNESIKLWQELGNNPYANAVPNKAPSVGVSSQDLPDLVLNVPLDAATSLSHSDTPIKTSLFLVNNANAQSLNAESINPDSVVNDDSSNVDGDKVQERWKLDSDILERSLESLPVRSRPKLYIQAGAFGQYANAARARALLNSISKVTISQVDSGDTPLFRVRLGPLKSVEEAEFYLRTVHENGFPEARILVVEQ